VVDFDGWLIDQIGKCLNLACLVNSWQEIVVYIVTQKTVPNGWLISHGPFGVAMLKNSISRHTELVPVMRTV